MSIFDCSNCGEHDSNYVDDGQGEKVCLCSDCEICEFTCIGCFADLRESKCTCCKDVTSDEV